MKYDKLVRDLIPEIIEKNGSVAITRTLTDEEYKVYLEKKLDEEVAEFHESKSIEELADIAEVIYSLCFACGSNPAKMDIERMVKKAMRGGFDMKTLLIETIDKGERS